MSIQSGNVLLQANFNVSELLGGSFGSTTIHADFNGSDQGVNIPISVGNGAGQINNLSIQGLSVPSGSPVSLNLTDGSVKMPDGSATNFADITILFIRNNGAAVLTVGGGTNAVTSIGTITVNPGAIVPIVVPGAVGYAVTASTANILKFTSASGTLLVDVLIAGH